MTKAKAMTSKGVVSLNKTVSKSRQGILYSEIAKHTATGKKLQIKIYSDSYDFQSYATIDIFNVAEDKWNRLESIHFSNMVTPHKLYYQLPVGVSPEALSYMFSNDRLMLVHLAKLVLDE